MKVLFQEISTRFPEIRRKIFQGDEELPYVLMNHLADWVNRLPEDAITDELIARVVSFTKWCEQHPSGKDADDDLLTILSVGFYEKLFSSDRIRRLLPKLISKTDIAQNADYLRTWVGADNYEKALKEYKGNK